MTRPDEALAAERGDLDFTGETVDTPSHYPHSEPGDSLDNILEECGLRRDGHLL